MEVSNITHGEFPVGHPYKGEVYYGFDGLLDKNPASRLGGGSSGGAEIMGHEFFRDIKWCDLESKQVRRRDSRMMSI